MIFCIILQEAINNFASFSTCFSPVSPITALVSILETEFLTFLYHWRWNAVRVGDNLSCSIPIIWRKQIAEFITLLIYDLIYTNAIAFGENVIRCAPVLSDIIEFNRV